MKVRFNPLLLIYVPVLWAVGMMQDYLILLLFLSIHEIVHGLVARSFNVKSDLLEFGPSGIKLEMNIPYGGNSSLEGVLIYLSGSLFNLIFAFAVTKINISGICLDKVIMSNLYIGIFNLIPIIPLDGSSIIFTLLKPKKGLKRAIKITSFISIIFGIISVIAVFIVTYNMGNYFLLFCISIVMLSILPELKYKRMEVCLMNIDALLKRKNKINKKKAYPVRNIAVLDSLQVYNIIPLLDHDSFHVITVLNERLEVCGSFTEKDVLEKYLNSCDKMTALELVQNHTSRDTFKK